MRAHVPHRLVIALSLLLVASPAFAGGQAGVLTGGGKISIFSTDAEGQNIEVTVRKDGDKTFLRIEGKDGTQVGDADADPTVVEVELTPGTFDEVSTDLGDAGDTLTVDLDGLPENLRFRKLEIEEEGDASGNDTVTVRNTTLAGPDNKVKVRLGKGDDTTNVEDCDTDKVDVVDNEGNNTTNVSRCNVDRELRIIGGRNHSVQVCDSFYGKATIKVKKKGGVTPSLDARIERSSGASLDLDGAGGDDVFFLDQVWSASLQVHGKQGDDSLFISNSTFDQSNLVGGPGFDCYETSNSFLGDPAHAVTFDQDFCDGEPPPPPPPSGGRAVILDYDHGPLPAGSVVCLDQVFGFPCTETGGSECPVERLRGDIGISGVPSSFPDLFPSFPCSHGPVKEGEPGCGPDSVPLCQ